MLDYQFVQESDRSFMILVETAKGADHNRISSELRAAMQDILDEEKLKEVTFTIEPVKIIKPDVHTGKKKLIKKNRSLTINHDFSNTIYDENRGYSKQLAK